MDIFKKHKNKILILIFLISMVCGWCVSCSMRAYYEPKWEKEDISAILEKETFEESDYEFLFRQTGLSEIAVKDLIEKGKKAEILDFAEQYFKKPEYNQEYLFFPLVACEVKTDEPLMIAPLKRGDVLVSLTTHTLGYRHGHSAIVVNGETGQIIEHLVLGEVSDYSYVDYWKNYLTFAVLRYKDSEIAEKAVSYAEENLIGIPYNPLAGIIKKDKSDEEKISSSNCSHLVWQAFYKAGADIDGNGGKFVLPGDFLECEDFEIVQIYGIEVSEF